MLVLRPLAVVAQDLTNAGGTIAVEPGAILYVGTGGLSNQANGTLINAGTLRTDGPLANAGTLDLSTGALEVRGDFTNAGTLTPGTSPVTFSGTTDQLLTPGGATLYQVLVNKPAVGANTLRLAGDLTVSNLLQLSAGLLNTQQDAHVYTVHLPNGATLSNEGAGRYVMGTVEVTRSGVSGGPVDFGLGAVLDPTTNNLGTVTITRRAGLLAADVSFGQNFTNHALQGIDRIWTVVPAAQPSAAVQLTLSWLPDDDHGLTDFSQTAIWQQAATGQLWEAVGPATDARSRRLTMNPLALNRFTVSNAPNPLPVTLVDFTAQPEGAAAARLRWTTATELNNASFTVERSLDGRTFTAIGTVAGAGTSAARHDYTLLDTKLPAGASLLYYRLGQADVNGTLTYAPVRTVALAPAAAGFVVYPTHVLAGQDVTYLYTGPAGTATIHVLDMLGRVLRSTEVDGRAQGEVLLAGLAPGSYLLHYRAAAASFTTSCFVQ
ncbi:MAG: T9SS type A sorting domain-containing protein [Janthinobacterium lividum]